MTIVSQSGQTLGVLITALIDAKTCGRDFYLAMGAAFAFLPPVAQVWRSLMFEESSHLDKMRMVQSLLTPETAEKPIDAAAFEKPRAVLRILTDHRVQSVETLEDAYQLAREYEGSGLQRIVAAVEDPFFPRTSEERGEHPHDTSDAQQRIESLQDRLENAVSFSLIPAVHGQVLPFARGPRRLAA